MNTRNGLAMGILLMLGTPSVQAQQPKSTNEAKGITSVIIDARGLGIERGMAPKIRFKDGREVWGTVMMNPDDAIEEGIVAYATSLETAKHSKRCGAKPLLLRAIPCGEKASPFDVCLSDDDAKGLLLSNKQFHFLDTLHVIFLVDK